MILQSSQSSLFKFAKFNSVLSNSVSCFCAVAATIGAASAISLGLVSPAVAGTLVRDDSGLVTRIEGLEIGEETLDVAFLSGTYNSLIGQGVQFDFSRGTERIGRSIYEALGSEEKLTQSGDGFMLVSGEHTDGEHIYGFFDWHNKDDWNYEEDHRRDVIVQQRNNEVIAENYVFAYVTDASPQEVPVASMLPAVLTVAAAALGKRKLAQSKNA